MKWFQTIWAFYVLMLSVMPCADGYAAGHEEAISSERAASVPDHHKGDGHDLCSPFCQCKCCGTTWIALDERLEAYPQTVKEARNVVIDDKFYFILSYHGSIWQPPKV
jgi:hypothetical protein